MAFVTIETKTIGGDVLLHQRDNPDGGHRVVVNGVNGTPAPFARVAVNGAYRASVTEGQRLNDLPGLFKVQIVSAGGLPELDVIITVNAVSETGRSLSFCDGVINKSFGTYNGAGGNSNINSLDVGGGPDPATLATDLKTLLDSTALDITVINDGGGKLTISPGATGLLVETTTPGCFVLT